MGPLSPSGFINGEVVIPRIGQPVSFALGVIAAVIAEVNGELERTGLTGIKVDFCSGKGRFKAGGSVWNPNVMGVFGVIDSPGLAVVEVVPVSFPCVSNTVGVGRNGGCGHHAVVNIVGIPNGVFGVVHNAVGVLVPHELERSSQSHGGIDVGQSVSNPPVVAFPGGASVARFGDVAARIFVVSCLAGILHAFVPSGQFENEFNFVNTAVVSLIPVLKLAVGCRAFSSNQAVAEVMVVSVVIRRLQGRGDIEQDSSHASDVRGGHRGP